MFDHARYRENMNMLIDKAYCEYQAVSHGIPGQQGRILKTYLWLGSVLGAFELGLYSKIMTEGLSIPFLTGQLTGHFYMFSVIAVLLSLGAFVLAVDALRGRGTQGLPFGDFTALAAMAFDDSKSYILHTLQPSILHAINEEIKIQAIYCDKRGKKLRQLSFLQLGSLCATICSIICLIHF